jgi:hypothetical protein
MVREADREEQIAAARANPARFTCSAAGCAIGGRAKDNGCRAEHAGGCHPQKQPLVSLPLTAHFRSIFQERQGLVHHNPATSQTATLAANTRKPEQVEELQSFIPAPKSLVSERGAAEVAAVNTSPAGNQNAVLSSMPATTESVAKC